jgi:hypothetical protein
MADLHAATIAEPRQHSPQRWKNRILCRDGSTWLGTMTWPSEAAARKHASNFGVGDDMLSEKGYVLIGKGT